MGEEWAGTSGTPQFAPPEQLLGEHQGAAADLYAAAAIVYFALTGIPPFEGGDARAILAQQLAGRIDLSPFHPALAAWLKRGLLADPDARFTDAAEMQSEWRRVSREVLRDESVVPFGLTVRRTLGRLIAWARGPTP